MVFNKFVRVLVVLIMASLSSPPRSLSRAVRFVVRSCFRCEGAAA